MAKFEIDARKRLRIETTNFRKNRFVFIYRNRGLGTTLDTLPLNIQVQGTNYHIKHKIFNIKVMESCFKNGFRYCSKGKFAELCFFRILFSVNRLTLVTNLIATDIHEQVSGSNYIM